MSKKVDLSLMIRKGWARPGQWTTGSLNWNFGGEPAGSISYVADMTDTFASELRLTYWRGEGEEREHVEQRVRLTFTEPNYGGRRWWMICPYRGNRVAKLYLPNWGDRFAGRRAWRLGYQSQRVAHRDRPFEKLFRLQRKLKSEVGWEAPLRRPKGMHQRTFDRFLDEYEALDAECAVIMMRWIGILRSHS
jgi:hypothetical protein